MQLHPAQRKIVLDNHRFRVVNCGRKFGKTTLSTYEIAGCAVSGPNKKVAYIATNYGEARDLVWEPLKKITRNAWAEKPNESRLEMTVKTQGGGTSIIYLRGWEAVENMRGMEFDLLVLDEVAKYRRFAETWEDVLRPTLGPRSGSTLFISTPKGFNHFYDLYNKAETDKDYASFHFTSYDNPYLPKTEIEKGKEESSPEAFAQEWLAEFRTSVGLTHKPWKREIHLIPWMEIPKEWQRVRGFDYGSTHPTSRVRFALQHDNQERTWYLERSYKVSQLDIESHAYALKTQDYGYGFMPSYGDPSGAQWFREFSKYGLTIQPATREAAQDWVKFGVERINQLLKPRVGYVLTMPNGQTVKDAPSLFVLGTEENMAFVREIERLQWKESRTGLTIEVLDEDNDPEGHFDLMAATRYLVVSHSGNMNTKQINFANLPRVEFDRYGNPII